jgi:apolipoprotein N-acyltransferase
VRVEISNFSYLLYILRAGAQGAEFIAWPEAGFTWDPQADNILDFPGLAAETGAYLALGYVVIGEEGFRNEATVLTPEGEYLGVFGKDHPVIFGGERSLTRGTYPVYDTTRKMTAQGAQLIGVPSNDWSTIADKYFTHAVFRAVENRVAMVKANGGVDSAIIDPRGQIMALASYPQGGEASLLADVAIGNGKGTILTRLGDWTGWLGLAGMIFFAFGGKFLEKRAKSEDGGVEYS